ncbi:Uncharacterised protein [Mycobacteroides abscessus]|nr:Uncharacterised protein [Mycobacteroides abscessus]
MMTRAPALAASTRYVRSMGWVSQYCTRVPGRRGAFAASCHATGFLPASRISRSHSSTKRAYSAGSIFSTSSPPRCTCSPSVAWARSVKTSRRKGSVAGRSNVRREKPTSMPW